MYYKQLLILLVLFKYKTCEEIVKEYASLPDLFYMDNYDSCMLRGDEAFYCSINYALEPIDPNNPSKLWNYIKNISSIETNYRHDHLRHHICVPKTCPQVNRFDENDPLLRKQLEDCYNNKFLHLKLKGNVTEITCQSVKPRYPIDGLDITCGIIFIMYLLFVLYATYYEGVARYKTGKEYQEITETPTSKILCSFSIIKNWIRLTTIKDTPDIKKLSAIQGFRLICSALLILCHTMMGFLATPPANVRFFETLHEQGLSIIFGSAHLAVVLFLFISDFLLSNELFTFMKDKQGLSIRIVVWIFVYRLFRQIPSLVFTILFHATWLRHMGSGPIWYMLIENEYKNCRNNGWTNLLFINNIINAKQMCLGPTWYFATSTQYFFLSLLFIWLLKRYEKYILPITGVAALLQIIAAFFQHYFYDLPCLMVLPIEKFYGLKNFLASNEFQNKQGSFFGNLCGPIFGIAFGYYFNQYNKSNNRLFNSKFRVFLAYVAVLGSFGCILIPGVVILYYSNEHDPFWASLYVALSRPIYAICIGTIILAFAEGIGGLLLKFFQHPFTYVMGRLAYSVFLVHMSIVLITPGISRYPTYTSYFTVITRFIGDTVVVFIGAILLTLFVELPVSALMKFVFVLKEDKKKEEAKELKNK